MAVIAQRVVLAVLGMYACALVYTSRSGMSVAIVAMTTDEQVQRITFNDEAECETTVDNKFHQFSFKYQSSDAIANITKAQHVLPKPRRVAEFDWNAELKGIILGSQYYLYCIMPTLAGRITDALGAKWVVLIGTLTPAALSAITPVATRSGGAAALIAIRTVTGALNGCIYAALFSLFIRWFPLRERVNANAGLILGGTIGSFTMYLLAGWLCDTSVGWPLVFYVNAGLYVPWTVLWLYFASDDPSQSKRISESELKYLLENNTSLTGTTTTSKRTKSVRYVSIITSPVVFTSLVSKMCAGFAYFLLSTEMPSYLAAVYGTPIFTNGAINSAMMLGHGLAGLGASFVSNWIISRFRLRVVLVRKAFQALATLGPALCLGLIPALGCDFGPVVTLLVLGMFLYGCYTGGEWTIASEYAPNSAGAVFGFTNILCFAMGFIAPLIEGALIDAPDTVPRLQWNLLFYGAVVCYVLAIAIFAIFGTDQQQHWDKLELLDSPDDSIDDEGNYRNSDKVI